MQKTNIKTISYEFHTDTKTEMDLLKELSFMKLIIALLVDKLSQQDRASIIENLRQYDDKTLNDYIKNFEKSNK
ncbi:MULTISPECIES: hypothetical protein [unclassified Providencia]|uniref:hypothetical protein n=1 Tax=unclassified Providencia TaxID=2633465 RepID=UPI0012B5D610|nr:MULTISPECIES: hypothetical protein [unclassified Providencia]MTC21801.1 hypothetical protein [Providencia sp. wls1938]